jgi:hypothetical protein
MVDYPIPLSIAALITFWLAAQIGVLASRRRTLTEDEREDFVVVQAATLTLLGLIIGFTFSMASTRYDQRKSYEAAEANLIGTEYLRVGLLPAADAAKLRAQLKKYLELRILFYRARHGQDLTKINAETAQLQSEMWTAMEATARAQPTPTAALAASGLNEVLDSQGYTQAAWWNRIPVAAWRLMSAMAVCCSFLIGYGRRSNRGNVSLFIILPVVVSIAFLLIADIDSPRGGLVRVVPDDLVSLSQSLAGQ